MPGKGRAVRHAPRPSSRARGSSFSASLCLLLLSACAPAYRHVARRHLPAGNALDCSSYLVWNDEPVRDVFLVINGSGTLSNAFVHPTLASLITSHRVAYATYDKPGIKAPFEDPKAVRRDYAMLERYTLGHGVACATKALHWAREQFGPSVRLHIRGHSEGTLVALYAYDAMLQNDTETAAAIATLVLSGLAVEPFAVILERQLALSPRGAQLREAFASCDWNVLRETLGVSCAYVEDAMRRPSGRAIFERLAVRAPRVQFHVFQGTEDWNTPIEPVRALETWNIVEGHLAMVFHYYDGGHAGSDAARTEVARLLTTIVSE